MNGSSYLHINGVLIDRKRLEKSLYMFQSSSPSYVIASSADIARDELTDRAMWEKTSFKEKIVDTGITVLKNDDMTRLVLNFSNFDITGFDVDDIFSNNGIDIEMADLFNIVLIITPSNTQADMDVLFD